VLDLTSEPLHKSMMPHGMCTLHADARPRLPYVVVVCES
jgi:hypothetical protein